MKRVYQTVLLGLLLGFFGCQENKVTEASATSTHSSSATATNALGQEDDFSDLKKEDDEACDTEEDLEKEIAEQAKKAEQGQAFKLQGGDEGCVVE